ncbi:hypothetical protein CEXT_210571 [Caerostris extrusa]|uniref:Uncharacterized protein n=1 Tax=Caerostris extrusa TaxID=172846 RepID=A0AAV4NEB4_CAEEX|nr:hypothetical protein CEXT_210571 [Caerostris extrusa]
MLPRRKVSVLFYQQRGTNLVPIILCRRLPKRFSPKRVLLTSPGYYRLQLRFYYHFPSLHTETFDFNTAPRLIINVPPKGSLLSLSFFTIT